LRCALFEEAGINRAGGLENARCITAAEIDRLIPVMERQPSFLATPYSSPNGRAELKRRNLERLIAAIL